MTTADLDPQRRAETIRSFDVLHQPARRDLVAVADLVAQVCDVPLASVNLLTDVELHQIATSGFEGSVCAVEDSMCGVVLGEEGPIVVPDCLEDPRLRDNPFVNGEQDRVRFYASSRLVTRDGVVIGTLCLFDHDVRRLGEVQVAALVTLADRVVDILELSLSSRKLSATLAEVEGVRAELEKSNARLVSFAGQVSHDLKTPLTSMALTLSALREELVGHPTADDATLPMLDRAISGSRRMAALIDDVLAYARLGGHLRHDDVDLARVLEHVRADLWERLDGVKIEVEELPVVAGDEVQLRAVLQNLLDNAAKYADPERPCHVRVGARRSSLGWRVEITDNGRGVPFGQHERILDPLTRADVSVAGSGIGLDTCRRIVEAHGGRIGLHPAATGGTTAWFELPG